MAVTPVGNPYVESSDLVANYPGVSEALAERIDVVGVNPFADSAARATAIPSPIEGQMASLNDDEKVYRYSGSAWVAVGLPPGLNPVSPTSIANSGGSASTTGNTTTFTTVTALSLNGVFTSAYDNYLIIMPGFGSTTAYDYFRLRVAGVDNSSSIYYFADNYRTNGSAGGANRTESVFWIGYHGPEVGTSETTIFGPQLAQRTRFASTNGSQVMAQTLNGYHDLTTQYDGFTIFPASGTITGTIQVFGYKD